MFGNFIYFIVALLIYTTYQPSDETNFTLFESLGLGLFVTLAFTLFTRNAFRKLEYRILQNRLFHLDHRFDQLLTRQSILAVALFAITIYALNLPSFFVSIPLFRSMPTFLALLFLALFVLFLSIVWASAYRCHRLMYRSDVSLRSYVVSNIAFSAPVLLPWILLSGVSDLIYALPFEGPKRLLATPGIPEEEAIHLIKDIARLKNLSIRGLMTMPPFFNAPNKVRPFFAGLKVLAERIRTERIPGVDMDELSMGMTGDFEVAIEEGATLVRVGTAIFGERS